MDGTDEFEAACQFLCDKPAPAALEIQPGDFTADVIAQNLTLEYEHEPQY